MTILIAKVICSSFQLAFQLPISPNLIRQERRDATALGRVIQTSVNLLSVCYFTAPRISVNKMEEEIYYNN